MESPAPSLEVQAGPFSLVRVFADDAALTLALAAALWKEAEQARNSGPSAVMLSGGSTPLGAYALLAAPENRPAPAPLHGFLSDERFVPVSDPGFNFTYARPFLRSVNPDPNAHPAIDPTLSLDEATTQYGKSVLRLLEQMPFSQGFLGMGADGHTAGLFTPDHLLQAEGKKAIGLHRPDERDGITLSPNVICQAEQLAFVVGGSGKKERLRSLCADPNSAVAGRIAQQHGHAELWTDLAAWNG